MTYPIGVVQLPGSNCERETKHALKRVGLEPVNIMWFDDIAKIRDCAGYVIVGGFSFEDRNRAGSIAAFETVIKEVIAESKTGKPVIGICNGAQILVETGVVPGYVDDCGEFVSAVALTANLRECEDNVPGTGYLNTWCDIYKHSAQNSNSTINIPIAHAEGRFEFCDAVFADLQQQGIELWRYVDNPNGSRHSIAAMGNFSGNVLAIMPHPERAVAGDVIFAQVREYLDINKDFVWRAPRFVFEDTATLVTREFSLKEYDATYFVRLAIADNVAISVQRTLREQGINIDVVRYCFWGLQFTDPHKEFLAAVEASAELWTTQKEIVTSKLVSKQNTTYCLVIDNFSQQAQHKKTLLQQRYSLASLTDLTYGIVWELRGEPSAIVAALQNKLLANPVSQRLYLLSEF